MNRKKSLILNEMKGKVKKAALDLGLQTLELKAFLMPVNIKTSRIFIYVLPRGTSVYGPPEEVIYSNEEKSELKSKLGDISMAVSQVAEDFHLNPLEFRDSRYELKWRNRR